MPTLDELITQHQAAHTAYSKMYAASKAVNKRLEETRQLRLTIRQQIAPLVGLLAKGTLVQTLNGSRFYEIVEGQRMDYVGATVYKHTGAIKTQTHIYRSGQLTSEPTVYLQGGSVIPVQATHPVYLKWQKQKFRGRLEGKE